MAGIEDLLKQGPLTTVAVGVGLVVLTPVLLPVIGRLSKPLVKEFIKQTYLIYEKTREGLAEIGELAEDAIAEAKVQLEMGDTSCGDALGSAGPAARNDSA
jgi:hypothetical protein